MAGIWIKEDRAGSTSRFNRALVGPWTTKPPLYHRDLERRQTTHILERLTDGEETRDAKRE